MSLFSIIERLRIAARINREYFPRVASGHEECAVSAECEVPNILGFGIKKDGLLSGRSDFVNFAVRGGGDVQIVGLIEDECLRRHLLGIEEGCGIAITIELYDFGI